jgi:DNA-binding PucR family transcriptional regulator
MAEGMLAGDPLRVDQRLLDLLIHRDRAVISALSAEALAPLAQTRDSTRERLAETLLAWLRHRGERQRIAEELHVHPQTVAYRVGQLRELFGDALNDADQRLAIELALRATGQFGGAGRPALRQYPHGG